MLQKSLPLPFLVQLRIVRQSKLYSTQEHLFGIKVTISLSNNPSIYTTWCMRCRRPMILHGFFHDFYLFCRKPFLQPCISSKNPATGNMMNSPWPRHPDIVVCRNGVCHINVGPHNTRQLQGTSYHPRDMARGMSLVEVLILWQNMFLHKLYQIKRCCFSLHNVVEKIIFMINTQKKSQFVCKYNQIFLLLQTKQDKNTVNHAR